MIGVREVLCELARNVDFQRCISLKANLEAFWSAVWE